jgi:hypothetical protein
MLLAPFLSELALKTAERASIFSSEKQQPDRYALGSPFGRAVTEGD